MEFSSICQCCFFKNLSTDYWFVIPNLVCYLKEFTSQSLCQTLKKNTHTPCANARWSSTWSFSAIWLPIFYPLVKESHPTEARRWRAAQSDGWEILLSVLLWIKLSFIIRENQCSAPVPFQTHTVYFNHMVKQQHHLLGTRRSTHDMTLSYTGHLPLISPTFPSVMPSHAFNAASIHHIFLSFLTPPSFHQSPCEVVVLGQGHGRRLANTSSVLPRPWRAPPAVPRWNMLTIDNCRVQLPRRYYNTVTPWLTKLICSVTKFILLIRSNQYDRLKCH